MCRLNWTSQRENVSSEFLTYQGKSVAQKNSFLGFVYIDAKVKANAKATSLFDRFMENLI